MSESATAVPDSARSEGARGIATRKVGTAHRITVCAQQLTDRHGFDGFTMDELAEAAGVSRRTLFNYFPGKLDAVVGPEPEIDHESIETFRAGGPHGELLEDIKVLVSALVEVKGFDREEAKVVRRIFRANPRLLVAVHDRFHAVSDMFTDAILAREGKSFGKRRAHLLISVLACLYDVALTDVLEDDSGRRQLSDAYFDALDTVRELLSC